MANRNCWAASIGGCAGKISREHVVSDGVLQAARAMNPGLKLVRIGMGGKEQPLSRATAVVRNLCEFHNSSLSPVDCEAQKLMQFVAASMEPLTVRSLVDAVKDRHEPMVEQPINGGLLERWALKTFLNHFSARGNSGSRDGLVRPSGAHIVNAVFNNGPLLPGAGLFTFMEPHARVHTVRHLASTQLKWRRKSRIPLLGSPRTRHRQLRARCSWPCAPTVTASRSRIGRS